MSVCVFTVEDVNERSFCIVLNLDSPWYEIQPGDAGGYSVTTKLPSKKKEEWNQGFSVKGRNEPSCIV